MLDERWLPPKKATLTFEPRSGYFFLRSCFVIVTTHAYATGAADTPLFSPLMYYAAAMNITRALRMREAARRQHGVTLRADGASA